MSAVEEFLRSNSLRGAKQETVLRLAGNAVEHEATKGQTLYKPGEHWPYVGALLEGALGMFAEGGNRDYLYEEIGPGALFGVSSMFDANATMARIAVLSKRARFLAFDNDLVRQLCDNDPKLAVLLATVLAHRVRGLTASLGVQVNLSTMTRMARYLLQHCVDTFGLAPVAGSLSLMTQAQIAAAAGTTKEVASRLIRTLEEADALKRDGGHIRYLDRDRIAAFATPNGG
jgi:CRP-like cAMP-binding protein